MKPLPLPMALSRFVTAWYVGLLLLIGAVSSSAAHQIEHAKFKDQVLTYAVLLVFDALRVWSTKR